MLQLQSRDPFWIEPLPGVRVHMRPIGPKAFRAAQQACFDALKGDEPDEEEASVAIEREIIRRGIIEWEGIGDLDGAPIAATAETIEAFLADPRTFIPTAALYVTPFLVRDLEGNGSAGSPDGTGAKATPAETTASSPAARRPKGAAKRAPIASTSRKRTKAKPSGK